MGAQVVGAKPSRRLLKRESWVVAPWPQGAWWCRVQDRGSTLDRKGLIEMLAKSLEEGQPSSVDERLARVVRIIVEEYDGDVEAFVESIRYREEVNRKAEAASEHGERAALQHV